MTIMIKVHTFPLFAIRPMYLAMRRVSRLPPSRSHFSSFLLCLRHVFILYFAFYFFFRQFKKAVTDAIMSRRAIRNMNTL